MLDRTTYRMKQALGACFAMALVSMPVNAATVDEVSKLRTQLRNFSAQMVSEPDANISARNLVEEAGLAPVVSLEGLNVTVPTGAEPPRPSGMIDAKANDMRFALGLIAQIYGAKDNQDVIEAQGAPDAQALVVYSGTVTLTEIFKQLDRLGLQSADKSQDGILRRPVIIWSDAALVLGPEDKVILSRTDGAFLANFGRLEVDGTEFTVDGPPSPTNTDFIPFVVNAGGASIKVRNASFVGLGFGSEAKFGGLSLVRNPLLVQRDQNVIENNSFTNVVSVSSTMTDGMVIRNNRFHDTRGPSLVVTHSVDTRIVGNLFSGDAPTNAIRLLQGSSRGVIAGNVVLDGDRSGIVVRNDSDNVIVRNNLVWHRGGGGISISKSQCAEVTHNLVMDNRQKGIEVRTAYGVVVTDNRIFGNRSSALWISDQKSGVATVLQDNVLLGNGAGLATADGEILVLERNDFTNQFPRFVDGDLSTQGRVIAANLDGSSPMVLTAGGLYEGLVPSVECGS